MPLTLQYYSFIIVSLFIHEGTSGRRVVVNGTNGQGSEGADVDEGCSRVMKDQAKMDRGGK